VTPSEQAAADALAGWDWLWCADCESVCRVWERGIGVHGVLAMLEPHRYWHCPGLRGDR